MPKRISPQVKPAGAGDVSNRAISIARAIDRLPAEKEYRIEIIKQSRTEWTINIFAQGDDDPPIREGWLLE